MSRPRKYPEELLERGVRLGGWLTKRGDAATARWMKPVLQHREIRRDTVRVLRAAAAEKNLMLDAAERLPWLEGVRSTRLKRCPADQPTT